MRSYIFTKRERRILDDFVSGRHVDYSELSKIMYRFKEYTVLPGDIDLYLRARKARGLAET